MIKTGMTAVFMLSSAFALAQGAANDKEEWDMERCIAYALTHATEITQKKIEAQNAREDRGMAVAGFMPQLSADISSQWSWGRNVDPETNTYNTVTTFGNGYGIGGFMTLFDGGRTYNTFRKAVTAVRQSDNAVVQAKDEKAIEVMACYVDALYSAASVRLAKDKLEDSRQLLRKTQRMEEMGEKSFPDVAQTEAQVADDEYSVEHLMTQSEKALLTLQKAMGMTADDRKSFSIEGDGNVVELRGMASDGGTGVCPFLPALLTAENAVRTSRFDLKIAWGNIMPSLSVGGGVNTSYYRNLSGGMTSPRFSRQLKDNMGEYVYATLKIPLFNYSSYKAVRKARNNVRIAEEVLAETRRKTDYDYREALAECEGYEREVPLMVRKVASDSLAHRLNTRKYEEGLLSVFDLHTSAQTLHDSRVRLLQTRLMAMIKRRLVCYYESGKIMWRK